MRASRLAALAALTLFACSTLAPVAGAAPERFPMPDGSTLVRDERDVAPFLAAWKAAHARHEAGAARAASANQLAYDARWYDLALTFTPGTSQVAGTVTMRATVTSGPLTSVDLDFVAPLVLDGATAGGVATTGTRAGDVLTLALDRAYATGETFTTTVTYHGDPTTRGYFGFYTANGRPLIWSLSEAYGARSWWPCKDSPDDKADSVDVEFTVPSPLTTASNGTLLSTATSGGKTTTHWREHYPIATYLVSIASYPYTVVDDWYRPAPGDSMLIRFHLFPETAPSVAAVDAKVKLMIAAFAARFGEYPFLKEKYGHAQFLFGGGMEHQTCTSLGSFNEWVVAHELTHQWFGDKVTCHDFHHIWLNEGFATYGEALWDEVNGGLAAYRANLLGNRWLGAGSVYVPDATDESRVFDYNLSYDKGSWVLHMLRHMLGDSTFFAGMRQYATQWGYQSATTENFRDVMEAVSGRDLHAYFQQWIYGEYHPIYRADWTSAPVAGGYDVAITLQQRQTWQLFTLPVDLRVLTSAGNVNVTLPDSLVSQVVHVHVAGQPIAVAIDPDDWILKETQGSVTAPAFDRSLLLVNSVDWGAYPSELASAYTDHAFSGAYATDFWDTFDPPAAGYPAALPAPLGHGAVPPEILGHYRNVVWVGEASDGVVAGWQETPVYSYLRAGGNVLLLAGSGEQFLDDSLTAALGIQGLVNEATLQDCLPTRPGFVALPPIGSQVNCAQFDTVRATPESELLFITTGGAPSPHGIGVVRSPTGGAGSRPHGGRFAFLSGRPYRWPHAGLATDVAAILATRFLEPANGAGVGGTPVPARLTFAPPRPNPAAGPTTFAFALPRAAHARLVVLDLAGRRVRTLLDDALAAGAHELAWDGTDARGTRVSAGLYWARLEAAGETQARRLVRAR